MWHDARFDLTFITTLGAALVAGTFFCFSTFIMRALGRLPAAEGIRAMQAINVTVITPIFMLVLFGAAALSLALAVWSALTREAPGSLARLVGCLLYLVGVIGVTIVFNVPRNNALATLDPANPASAGPWADYLREWTLWNHVRAVGATAASAALLVALILDGAGASS